MAFRLLVLDHQSAYLTAHTGTKIKTKPTPFQRNTQRSSRHGTKGDEAREVLANTLLNHVPVVRYNFQAKVCP